MNLRKIIRALLPSFLLNEFRNFKRRKFNRNLSDALSTGNSIPLSTLAKQLEEMGIVKGDSLLVHASLRNMGIIEDGANTVIEALVNAVGESGNLLMPSSPVVSLQLDYVKSKPIFDSKATPSCMGAISEKFRLMPGVRRSLHPTEPVCALGPKAQYLTEGHFNQLTPYNANSPFYRLCELKGKILYVGVTLDNAGTSLHVLEDTVDFPYPVYHSEIFDLMLKDEMGELHQVKTKVHSPIYSKKRRCDELIPLFIEKKACKRVRLGEAACLLFDADLMLKTMKEAFILEGVTMYTPNGMKV
ncbi:MAG: AAC(3) family N-acetyltransferase [Crocinitomicaceae bacterium]|nr:AAC(3) family N-acetyltransferase [Crocinitomicaceae bacterium]